MKGNKNFSWIGWENADNSLKTDTIAYYFPYSICLRNKLFSQFVERPIVWHHKIAYTLLPPTATWAVLGFKSSEWDLPVKTFTFSRAWYFWVTQNTFKLQFEMIKVSFWAPSMTFLSLYVVCVLAFIPKCRSLCSKPEIINFSPQGFSLGIGHTFKTFPTPSVFACMEMCISYPMCRSIDLNREIGECRLQVKSSVTDPGLLVSTPNTFHMDKEHFPQVSIKKPACNILISST